MLGFNFRSQYVKIGLFIFIFSSRMGQPSNPVRQQNSSPSVYSRQSKYQALHISESAQSKPTPHTGFSQMGQQSSYRPPNPTHQYSQQSRPLPAPSRPSAHAVQPQNSFGPQRSPFQGNRSTNQPQTATQVEKYVENDIEYIIYRMIYKDSRFAINVTCYC